MTIMTIKAQIDPQPRLAQPSCQWGYTREDLEVVLGGLLGDFDNWMRQTDVLCDGRRYNPSTGEYEPSGCGPHGPVVYEHDLRRYLAGAPVID